MTANATGPADLTIALRALADPIRRRVLGELRQREECVSVLAERLGITTALVSHHLHVMVGAGFVQERHHGPWRCYSLVAERLEWLRDEMDRLLDPSLGVEARPGSSSCAANR